MFPSFVSRSTWPPSCLYLQEKLLWNQENHRPDVRRIHKPLVKPRVQRRPLQFTAFGETREIDLDAPAYNVAGFLIRGKIYRGCCGCRRLAFASENPLFRQHIRRS